jgi:hypothetical protein
MKKLLIKYGGGSILVGAAAILAVIIIEGRWPNSSVPVKYALKFLDHAGIAFLSIGTVGLFLELPEWRKHFENYFHEQIVATIIDKEYLKTFDPKALTDLQTKTLKAEFKIEDIDREGSFLNFYLTKIQNFIGSPYRENTRGVTKLQYAPGGNESFVVEETISFRCRKLGERIQPEVKWITERDEIDEVRALKILVRVPPELCKSPTFAKDYSQIAKEAVFDMNDKPAEMLTKYAEGHGHILSLEKYKEIDKLFIEMQVTYVVPTYRAFSWSMPYPSKDLEGEIHFPKDLQIFVDLFLDDKVLNFPKDENSLPISEEDRKVYAFNYPGWLLPDDGLAFHFRKSKTAVGVEPES